MSRQAVRRFRCWLRGYHIPAAHPTLPALFCDYCGVRLVEPAWFMRALDDIAINMEKNQKRQDEWSATLNLRR